MKLLLAFLLAACGGTGRDVPVAMSDAEVVGALQAVARAQINVGSPAQDLALLQSNVLLGNRLVNDGTILAWRAEQQGIEAVLTPDAELLQEGSKREMWNLRSLGGGQFDGEFAHQVAAWTGTLEDYLIHSLEPRASSRWDRIIADAASTAAQELQAVGR